MTHLSFQYAVYVGTSVPTKIRIVPNMTFNKVRTYPSILSPLTETD